MIENLYSIGDIVWMSEESCYSIVTKVRRPVGLAHYRYDLIDDDDDKHVYVPEYELYPSSFEHENDGERRVA